MCALFYDYGFEMPTEKEIENYILQKYAHIVPLNSWGELSFFINPDQKLKRGTYFATLKSKDGENDKASNLDRKDVFRLNIGISKPLYLSIFGTIPKRPQKGGIVEAPYDFQEADLITPHPVYGWMCWVSVINPQEQTFSRCLSLLDDAYQKAYAATLKKLK